MGSNVFKGCKVKVAAPKKTGDVGFEIASIRQLPLLQKTLFLLSTFMLFRFEHLSIALFAMVANTEIEYIEIPEGVKSIGSGAFKNCNRLFAACSPSQALRQIQTLRCQYILLCQEFPRLLATDSKKTHTRLYSRLRRVLLLSTSHNRKRHFCLLSSTYWTTSRF